MSYFWVQSKTFEKVEAYILSRWNLFRFYIRFQLHISVVLLTDYKSILYLFFYWWFFRDWEGVKSVFFWR